MTVILSLLIGLIGYAMDKPIKKWFDGDFHTSELASWTFGGLLILVAFIFSSGEFMSKEERSKAIMSLCGALVGVGAGVTIAKVTGMWGVVKP
jgi:hypothetical protein